MKTLRGSHPVFHNIDWRLDGSSEDPTSPLLLALHGMGMDEDVFARLLTPLLNMPISFLIPRGLYPMEIRGEGGEGRIGASWYAYDGDQDRFRLELLRTESHLLALLASVEHGQRLKPRKRYLLGFSQGGYCGAFIALRHPEIFSGMIICGARVKWEFLHDEMKIAGALGFRALLCHGARDPAVSIDAAERSYHELTQNGVDTRLIKTDTGHSFGRTQTSEIRTWLESAAFGASEREWPHR
ncbi:MAG TPA: alpha/beta fold hydrolase [bacterium]|nr:alpha/beta fold hydrolase [bacterium]